jgi:hypothetical protein
MCSSNKHIKNRCARPHAFIDDEAEEDDSDLVFGEEPEPDENEYDYEDSFMYVCRCTRSTPPCPDSEQSDDSSVRDGEQRIHQVSNITMQQEHDSDVGETEMDIDGVYPGIECVEFSLF